MNKFQPVSRLRAVAAIVVFAVRTERAGADAALKSLLIPRRAAPLAWSPATLMKFVGVRPPSGLMQPPLVNDTVPS